MTRKKEDINRRSNAIDWGELRRLSPISSYYGFDRGTPVDRYYIELFLQEHNSDIKGDVLEMQNRDYTTRFGGNHVIHSDVLDINRNNKLATIYADLTDSQSLPVNKYDCIVLTQTLHLISAYNSVLNNVRKMLKKNGVLLVTLPTVSRIDPDFKIENDVWRFTPTSGKLIFSEHFKENKLTIKAYGNILASVAFLYGISAEEMTREELDHDDPFFPLLVCVKAQK